MDNHIEKNSKSFEEAVKELETIVLRLEKGDIPLEASIEEFQKGMALSKYIEKILGEMEKKILILTEDRDGNVVEQDFIPGGL